MNIKEILDLLTKKYPSSFKNGMNPVLFIYDDGSGRILKDANTFAYDHDNVLYEFASIDDLVDHLHGGQDA